MDEAPDAHLAGPPVGCAAHPKLPPAAEPRRGAELPAARPKGTDFDLALRSSAGSEGHTKARGSDDRLAFRLACRNRATQDVRLTVTRRSGAGSFRVVARYAG